MRVGDKVVLSSRATQWLRRLVANEGPMTMIARQGGVVVLSTSFGRVLVWRKEIKLASRNH